MKIGNMASAKLSHEPGASAQLAQTDPSCAEPEASQTQLAVFTQNAEASDECEHHQHLQEAQQLAIVKTAGRMWSALIAARALAVVLSIVAGVMLATTLTHEFASGRDVDHVFLQILVVLHDGVCALFLVRAVNAHWSNRDNNEPFFALLPRASYLLPAIALVAHLVVLAMLLSFAAIPGAVFSCFAVSFTYLLSQDISWSYSAPTERFCSQSCGAGSLSVIAVCEVALNCLYCTELHLSCMGCL